MNRYMVIVLVSLALWGASVPTHAELVFSPIESLSPSVFHGFMGKNALKKLLNASFFRENKRPQSEDQALIFLDQKLQVFRSIMQSA
jgi:hypothetical protein